MNMSLESLTLRTGACIWTEAKVSAVEWRCVRACFQIQNAYIRDDFCAVASKKSTRIQVIPNLKTGSKVTHLTHRGQYLD